MIRFQQFLNEKYDITSFRKERAKMNNRGEYYNNLSSKEQGALETRIGLGVYSNTPSKAADKTINSVIKKHKTENDHYVYRHIPSENTKFDKNNIMSHQTMLHTSRNSAVAFKRAHIEATDGNGEAHILKIKVPKGSHHYAGSDWEKEVTLLPGKLRRTKTTLIPRYQPDKMFFKKRTKKQDAEGGWNNPKTKSKIYVHHVEYQEG